jgi:Fic family protein
MTDTKYKNRIGKYQTVSTASEKFKAYIPSLLPFSPAIDYSGLKNKYEKALLNIGELNGFASKIPNIDLILYFYIRKEALISSQIEGTQSTFDDVLLYENDGKPKSQIDDVEEVSNYVAALNHGIKRIKGGFPLSARLIKEMHKILLKGSRGSKKQPGEFRRSQNWIGGTRPGNAAFVPPPHEALSELITNLEKYLNNEIEPAATSIEKAAISHVQFETIHPFLDGNGRLGRLLITLLLQIEGLLDKPILYLSLYFKQNRKLYYELLDLVRINGRWEVWYEFFLDAIIYTSKDTIKNIKNIEKIFASDSKKIERLGRARINALKVYEYFKSKPITNIQLLSKDMELSQPAITKILSDLIKLKIISESSGKKRERVFVYNRYLDILKEGTEIPE